MKLRIGTRRSPLALTQARWVAERLAGLGVDSELVGITTHGDIDQRELVRIGGAGVFTGAVRNALLNRAIDLAVHSAKDLPTAPEPGLVIAAYPAREDPRDVLIGRTLEQLRDGDRIGTGSPRRASQLLAYAAERGIALDIAGIRGNVDSRIARIGHDYDAILLAAAGLRRLGRLNSLGPNVQILDPEEMLPAPAQGALAVEAAEHTDAAIAAARLDDPLTRACVQAERAVLARLEAGCSAPVGALATANPAHDTNADLTLAAVIGRTVPSTLAEAAPPGALLRASGVGSTGAATALGTRLADELLARLDRSEPHRSVPRPADA